MSKIKRDERIEKMRRAVVRRIGELWEDHESEFLNVVEETDNRKISLGFTVQIDMGQPTFAVTTKIGFSARVSDDRKDTFDDPNQPALPGIGAATEEATGPAADAPKKGRKKKQEA